MEAGNLCLVFIERRDANGLSTSDFLEWYDLASLLGREASRFFGDYQVQVGTQLGGLLVLILPEIGTPEGYEKAENLFKEFMGRYLPETYDYAALYTNYLVPRESFDQVIRQGIDQYEHASYRTRGILMGKLSPIWIGGEMPQRGNNEELIRDRLREMADTLEAGNFEEARVFFTQMQSAFRLGDNGIHPRRIYVMSMSLWILQYFHEDEPTLERISEALTTCVLGDTWVLYIIARLEEICAGRRQSRYSRFDRFETKVHRLIDADITNPELNLKTAADYFDLTPTYFSQQFKKHMGVGFLQYVENRRMQLGYALLKQSDMTIEKTAASCGYESVTTFRRNFKEHFGINPGEVRG